MKFLKSIEGIILKIEYFAVIVILLSMCFLAFSQVVLRNIFSFSFIWADISVRTAVLWVAILGASIATSEKGHIHIDLFSKILHKPYDEYLDAVLRIIAAVVCFLFFLVAIKFVSVEREVGNIVNALHTPEWVFTLIFPIGFAVMAYKFFIRFLENLVDMKEKAGRVETK